jgi:hypothetical protein
MKVKLLTIPTKVAPRMLKLSDVQEAQAILEPEIEQALAELCALEALSRSGRNTPARTARRWNVAKNLDDYHYASATRSSLG